MSPRRELLHALSLGFVHVRICLKLGFCAYISREIGRSSSGHDRRSRSVRRHKWRREWWSRAFFIAQDARARQTRTRHTSILLNLAGKSGKQCYRARKSCCHCTLPKKSPAKLGLKAISLQRSRSAWVAVELRQWRLNQEGSLCQSDFPWQADISLIIHYRIIRSIHTVL